jgi:hypothetical protein
MVNAPFERRVLPDLVAIFAYAVWRRLLHRPGKGASGARESRKRRRKADVGNAAQDAAKKVAKDVARDVARELKP